MELFDTKSDALGQNERALLVYVTDQRSIGDDLQEFEQLVESSGVRVLTTLKIANHKPNAKFFIGTGKATQLAELSADEQADVVIINHTLSPSQERNLERICHCRVVDRTGLILDIFALRARSFEGRLQVELAQLKHLSTRLIRGWTHLERQKGGIGLRGPGETQLETDRRLIGHRIKHINRRLEKVDKKRTLGRRARVKNQTPIISLVGYTNAGKSSLFNVLTNADVYADDKLFATLDATLRRICLPASGEAVIADTVGFIENLPPDLIASFKSTLAEVLASDVLLHVVDAADEGYINKTEQVDKILTQIGAEHIKTLIVMNKIDLFDEPMTPRIDYDSNGRAQRIWLSTVTKEGVMELLPLLSEFLDGIFCYATIKLPLSLSKLRSDIYQTGYVNNEKMDESGNWRLEIKVTKHYLDKLKNTKGVELIAG